MAVIKCGGCGQYYNDGQYSECQSCGVSPEDVFAESSEVTEMLDTSEVTASTVALGKYASEPNSDDSFISGDHDDQATIALDDIEDDPDDQVTVAMVKKDSGIDPVCGWFICIDGPDKGRDFRIKTERNFIGRGPNMDIVINGDDSISRENHASITFDPRKIKFTISTGDGRGLVYLNQEVVDASVQVKAYDLIEIGETKLMFMPFVSEEFSWDN
jgi:hypothetical protein